ncbi:MAG TPA: methylated-DNA--[protein]-cysteine S-methyltransferase [Gemmatimonadales bacterium]|nr:methylated-DNA--[protein]-cysteine S-methyltransferase [Gemmatimonadales bacterium]
MSTIVTELPTGLAPADAWAAVLARDAAQDGRFVYAVRTTGVFCRPSCSARRPRRENVAFFPDARAAAAAGYRACRRCRPESVAEPAAARAVARARAFLDAHPDEAVPLDRLAREVGLSPHHLQRTFTRLVGTSPKRYAAALRAERFRTGLRDGATVSRAGFDAGFGAASRAYDAAAAHLGMTPAAYRRGGRGVHVRYALAATALGPVLVAATRRGVCAVTLGDDDATLEAALAAEYPEATRERLTGAALAADPDLQRWLASVVRAAGAPPDGDATAPAPGREAGTRSLADVPLDVPGTPFQDRVWRAVRAIPRGETRSYTEVATALGVPRAVRAVASAIASNRVALVVPCHRVVPKGAAPAGSRVGQYRWGPERKRRLLAQEREDAPATAGR